MRLEAERFLEAERQMSLATYHDTYVRCPSCSRGPVYVTAMRYAINHEAGCWVVADRSLHETPRERQVRIAVETERVERVVRP